MNIYTAILKEYSSEIFFYLVELLDRNDILTLKLKNRVGEEMLVVFEEFLAYRKLDEGDSLIENLNLSKCEGFPQTFYLAEESDFLDWFIAQSYGKYQSTSFEPLRHYVVATSDDVIDVISFDPPVVTRINKPF